MNVFDHIRTFIEPKVVDLSDSILRGSYTTIEEYREAVGKLSSYLEIKQLLSEAEAAMEEDENE